MISSWIVSFLSIICVFGFPCEYLDISVPKVRHIHEKTNFIGVYTRKNLNYDELNQHVSITFQPPLHEGIDYEFHSMKAENYLPHQFRRNNHGHVSYSNSTVMMTLGLSLIPGRSWAGSLATNILKNSSTGLNQQGSVIDLRIVDAYVCDDKDDFKTYSSSSPSSFNSTSRIFKSSIPIAHIHTKSIRCPHLSHLPDIEPELALFLKFQLGESCANVKIVKSKRLYAYHMSSLTFLSHHIPLLLIDGSDQNMTEAAQSVDDFLAPHSVLDVVWEPYSSTEPQWFLLMPRPRGMPGHLFAMLDSVQWEHPAVINVNRHHHITNHSSIANPQKPEQQQQHSKSRYNDITSIGTKLSGANTSFLLHQCNATSAPSSKCIMGCPDTFLSRMTGSGWGADAWHLSLDVRRALILYEPFQAAPHMLSQHESDEDYPNVHGYEYTYQGCSNNKSHFLDCYFLQHSPCPTVRIDPYTILTQDMNRSRVKGWNTPNMGDIDRAATEIANQKWWSHVLDNGGGDTVGTSNGSNNSNNKKTRTMTYMTDTGQKAIEEYEAIPPSSVSHLNDRPAEHVFYTFALRPNYSLRKAVYQRVNAFHLDPLCASMHVRRGDSISHNDQSRAYIRVESYVRAGRRLMDAMNISTIMLFTDSHSAIEEALNCAQEYPDVCRNITFRFLNKTRFHGAEGGWENHFPSGNPRLELLQLQTEFSLTQQCQMIITGQSSYGEKLHNHMCCGSPLQGRGKLPQRCICPPLVRVSQGGFATCEEGNLSQCKGEQQMSAKDMTLNHKVSMGTKEVWLNTLEKGYHYKTATLSTDITNRNNTSTPPLAAITEAEAVAAIQATQSNIHEFVTAAVKLACRSYDHGPALSRKPFCHDYFHKL